VQLQRSGRENILEPGCLGSFGYYQSSRREMVVDCHFEGQGNRSIPQARGRGCVVESYSEVIEVEGDWNRSDQWQLSRDLGTMIFDVPSRRRKREKSRLNASPVPKQRSRGELAALKQRVQATPASLELPLPGNAPRNSDFESKSSSFIQHQPLTIIFTTPQ